MKLQTAMELVAAGQKYGMNVSLYENYGARNSFGKLTTGVVTNDISGLMYRAGLEGVLINNELKTDNLGRDFILY